jgi:hypothetical protein
VSDSALSPVSAALAKGKTLGEVLRGLVKPKRAVKPTKVAISAQLSEKDKETFALLLNLYGGVNPQDRTKLTDAQLATIMEERKVLDQVASLVKNRTEGVRTTVLNHFDIGFEESEQVDENTPLDKDGHYLLEGTHQVPAPGTHWVFSWEVSQADPVVNTQKVYDLCHAEGSRFTHKDWLAMSYQPPVNRLFSEEKAMSYLNAHPELLAVIQGDPDLISDSPAPRGAFWTRKEKA